MTYVSVRPLKWAMDPSFFTGTKVKTTSPGTRVHVRDRQKEGGNEMYLINSL